MLPLFFPKSAMAIYTCNFFGIELTKQILKKSYKVKMTFLFDTMPTHLDR